MSIPWSSNRRGSDPGYLQVQHPFSTRTMYPQRVDRMFSRKRLMEYTAEVPFVEERLVPLDLTIPSNNIRDGWYPAHAMSGSRLGPDSRAAKIIGVSVAGYLLWSSTKRKLTSVEKVVAVAGAALAAFG